MRSLWDGGARRELYGRLAQLAPVAAPRWGRLTAPHMVAHLIDAARLALGELTVGPRRSTLPWPLRLPLAKQLFVYSCPFPRNAPSAPELFATVPGQWADDVATLERLLERLAVCAAHRDAVWPEHPFFGRLSTRAWGALGYRHMDHHLRQFGV